MYTRLFKPPVNKSFFIFGPRGTGKTTWLKTNFKDSIYIDLLENETYVRLLAHPERIEEYIPPNYKDYIIIDEVQKIPLILNEVHRLIEKRKVKFVLTGSSARKLRRKGVNLLAGRALTLNMYPLTAIELKNDFDIIASLKFGHLPSVFSEENKEAYLNSYIGTYLKEEVQQEGLTRNLSNFARFLEASSFSQGSILNISSVARECNIERKVVQEYFNILEDLLIAYRVNVFTKKAKRKLVSHPKFYFFDVGVFRGIRPSGPLDDTSSLNGICLETLVLQEIIAINSYFSLNYKIYFWRTSAGDEVDFVLYGKKGLIAIEVKLTDKLRDKDLNSLKTFKQNYSPAKLIFLYSGKTRLYKDDIKIIPVQEAIQNLPAILESGSDDI